MWHSYSFLSFEMIVFEEKSHELRIPRGPLHQHRPTVRCCPWGLIKIHGCVSKCGFGEGTSSPQQHLWKNTYTNTDFACVHPSAIFSLNSCLRIKVIKRIVNTTISYFLWFSALKNFSPCSCWLHMLKSRLTAVFGAGDICRWCGKLFEC